VGAEQSRGKTEQLGPPASLHFASLLRRLLLLDRGMCHDVSLFGHFGHS